jgi:chromosomal replication initiator protein
MYLSKDLTKSSLKSIGLQFGGRDHSTVIHACNAVEESVNNDPNMRDLVKAIKTQIEMVSS